MVQPVRGRSTHCNELIWLPCSDRIAKVAKEKMEELDVGAMVRPVHGRSASQDASRGDDVPEHYYQCVLS